MTPVRAFTHLLGTMLAQSTASNILFPLERPFAMQLLRSLERGALTLTKVDLEEDSVLKADGLDDAIVGIARPVSLDNQPVLVYDVDKVVEIFRDRDGMTLEEAIEFFDFNIDSAYVGLRTPIYLMPFTKDDLP